jgi:hypothetical protein
VEQHGLLETLPMERAGRRQRQLLGRAINPETALAESREQERGLLVRRGWVPSFEALTGVSSTGPSRPASTIERARVIT